MSNSIVSSGNCSPRFLENPLVAPLRPSRCEHVCQEVVLAGEEGVERGQAGLLDVTVVAWRK